MSVIRSADTNNQNRRM